MRKWLILGAIAFLLLGAGAVAVRNFNSYLNQNKACRHRVATTGKPFQLPMNSSLF